MSVLRKLLVAVAVVIILVAATIAVAGFFVPAERVFANEITIDAPAEKVWEVLADRERFPEWQNQLDRVEIIDETSWIEHPKDVPQPLRFELVSDRRPTGMEFSYTMGDSVQGFWKGEITPSGSGVTLKTIDGYRTDSWLIKMMMGAFFDLDSFAKDWNSKLKQRVETLEK